MQDPTSVAATTTFPQLKTPQFPEQEQLKCPRCDSINTKFCYYNNYNLSQPRHYCKSCRRYWTKGGALRNIPIGGGSRKNTKKSSSSKRSLSLAQTQLSPSDLGLGSAHNSEAETKPVPTLAPDVGTGLGLPSPARGGVGIGSFTSLLGMATDGHFGNLMVESLGSSGLWLSQGDGPGQNLGLELLQGNDGGGSESCCGGSNNNSVVWPDLAIYTTAQPGSTF